MNPKRRGGLDQAALLEQVSWIRRLARELVSDRELADDLVQETCAVALEHGPREAGKLRQWLAEVLRNALRQHARSAGRRLAREARVARPEALAPAAELVARALLQRELVNAVLELDEPYRATVLLRFFEELPPREIARRTGAPLATVNSRLQRALARLRTRLDGHQPTWAALFLPWVQELEPLAPLAVAPMLVKTLMKTKLILAAATVVVAGAFVWWTAAPDAEPRVMPTTAAAVLAAPAPLVPALSGERPADGPPRRVALSSSPGATAPRPAAASGAEPWTVRLRVLDAEGLALPGIAVVAEGSEAVLGTSGAGGWCVFETRSERLVLSASDRRWVTIHEGSPSRTTSVDPVLVLAPALALAGSVRDEGGRSLPGASVRFELPAGFRARFEELLEASRVLTWRVGADPEGRFALERVPAVAGATVTAVLAGYERALLAAPLRDAEDLELVLARPVLPLAGTLRGLVRDPLGTPVAGARVGLGLASVVSDERGRFELALARAVTTEVLSAVKAGFLPARMERPGEPGPGTSGWPDAVELWLAGPALTLRGVVLDHQGQAVAGAKVWVHDPTPGAPIGMMPTYLEPLMAGAPVPPSALESEAHLAAEDGDSFHDWHTSDEQLSPLWSWVVTDATGHFELGGLDRRRYRLDVLRPGSLAVATSTPFEAGELSAVVRLGPPEVFERVSGRVLAEDGAALADVEVCLYRPVIDAHARVYGGRSQVVILRQAGTVTTDAEGRFTFADVPRRGASVSVRADGIVPRSMEVSAEALDVLVEQRCHLEVVLREWVGRFDAISVADREGNPLDLLVLTEGSINAWTAVPLVEGRSGVVSASSRARILRLHQGEQVLETRALDLFPGSVNRVEL